MRELETAPVQSRMLQGSRAAAGTRAVLAAFAFGIPIDGMPLLGFASITPMCVALLVAAAGWHVVSTGRLRTASTTLLVLTAFTAWGAASVLWAREVTPAQTRLLTYLQLLASSWLAWQIVRDERDLRAMLGGYLAGCCLVVAGAWQAFLSGVTYYQQRPEIYHDNPDIIEQRFTALGFDPNDMGVTLALGVPMAAYLFLQGKGRSRYAWIAFAPIALSGIALSGSRGSTITAAVACGCVLVWIGQRSVTAAAVTLALVLAGAAVAWSMTPDTWERILTIHEQLQHGTVGQRLQIWRAGFHVLLQHPATGVGVGGFEEAVRPELGYAIVAHNAILSVAVEVGVTGVLLFLGAFGWVARSVMRTDARARGLVVAVVLVWLVGVLSLSWEYRKTTWFLLLLGAAVAGMRRTVDARSDPAASRAA